jgi:hypothetical protein
MEIAGPPIGSNDLLIAFRLLRERRPDRCRQCDAIKRVRDLKVQDWNA